MTGRPNRFTPLLAGIAAAIGAGGIATAQTINSGVGIAPSQQLAQPTAPAPTQAVDAPTIERLFGDWAGMQTQLGALGINIQVDAITELAGNLSGGVKQGATFASQAGFEADINWERLAGLTGLSTHAIIVNRSGSSDSALFGDHLLPVQEIYGSGGDVALHLVSAYAQETLLDRTLDVAVGRMNVENDFASSPLYCNFMNNALCGDPKALPGGDIGHSAYPDAVWGGRVRFRPAPTAYVQLGAYEVNQGLYGDASFRSGFAFKTTQDSGAYLPVELGWLPAWALPGHYKLGAGYDTSAGYKTFSNALAAQGLPGYTPRFRTGNTQLWVLADQMLVRNGAADRAGIIVIGAFIHNDTNNTVYGDQYVAGLLDRGFWGARPADGIGVLLSYNTVSGRLAAVQEVQHALGLPYANGATGIQTHEMVIEANYDIHVVPGVNFEPDAQYVIRPNAQANLHDAGVLGFKAHVEF